MPNPRLRDLLLRAAERLHSELRDDLIPHRGESGRAREESLRKFLRSNLPSRFDVSTGFVFDSDGSISDQLDIVIADPTLCPRFETAGGIRLFPCESVVAVGQVKSKATSRRELWGAFDNLRSVSVLDRSGNGTAFCSRLGVPLDPVRNHLHRIFTFVFVSGEALSGESTQALVAEAASRAGPHLLPNIVFALDRYLVTYACDDGVCPNTFHARGVALSKAASPAQNLLGFYVLLSQALSTTSVAASSSSAYLMSFCDFDAHILHGHGGPGEEPPYIESWELLPWSFPDNSD